MIKEMYPEEMWPKLYKLYPEYFPEPTEEQLLDDAARTIRRKYAKLMDDIVKPYLKTEQLTWDAQVKEADAYLFNNQASTPMLQALATNRGVTLSDLVSWIKENEMQYKQAVGTLLGMQQAELDTLYNQGE